MDISDIMEAKGRVFGAKLKSQGSPFCHGNIPYDGRIRG